MEREIGERQMIRREERGREGDRGGAERDRGREIQKERERKRERERDKKKGEGEIVRKAK